MLALSIIIFSGLIFPIFLNLDIYYREDVKKLFFSVSLFNLFRIIGGYITLSNDGFFIHLSKNKAFFVPYINLVGARKKIKPLKDYHIISFYSILELRLNPQSFTGLFPIIYVWHNDISSKIIKNIKPYVKLDNRLFLYKMKKDLELFIETKTIFNLLMIVLSLIKILTEKIIYAFNK